MFGGAAMMLVCLVRLSFWSVTCDEQMPLFRSLGFGFIAFLLGIVCFLVSAIIALVPH